MIMMKKTIKRFFLLINLSLKSIYSIILILFYRAVPQKLFHINSERKDDIFILTTGPSLISPLEIYSKNIKKRDVLAVNDFCLSPNFEIIQPTYYFLADAAYLADKQLSPKFVILQENIMVALLQKVSWKLTIFIPNNSQNKNKWEELSQQNHYIQIVFINTNTIEGFAPLIHYLFRKNLGMPRVQNVLIGAIFISLNMRYTNIYLLGADHSLHQGLVVDENSNLCIQTKHFDKIGDKQLYYKDYTGTEIFKIHEFFLSWSRTFDGYHVLKRYASALKANIYNTTEESFIDAFPKIQLSKILKNDNK